MKRGVFLLFLFFCSSVMAQPALLSTVKVTGSFLTDTLKTGLPIQYVLVARHPADTELLFPDSSYLFEPFEWLSLTYFPTRTTGSVSTDSVVYELVSYHNDPQPALQLPVFVIEGKDCTAIVPKPAFLIFKPALRKNTVALQKSIDYQPVTIEEDVNKYILIAGAGVLALGLVWSAFGRRIRQALRLYQLSLQHRGFAGGFDRLQRRLRQESTNDPVAKSAIVESAMILWKNYLEDLENIPFSTYTSKEILNKIPDEALAEALRDIDKVVYGQVISGQAALSLQVLEDISLQYYRRKRETLKNEFKT